MILDVVTPEKSIVTGENVESVVIPGADGQMNVLPEHANLITSLKPGSFAYKVSGSWKWAVISGGFAQVNSNKLTVLAETMELKEEIDQARAELALKRADENLKQHDSMSKEYAEAFKARARAMARLEGTK